MPIQQPEAPDFAVGLDGTSSITEFEECVSELGVPAAQFLGELTELHNYGDLSDIRTDDNARTHVRNLYCRALEKWFVFYSVDPRPPHAVTVLHAVDGILVPLHVAESEAADRLNKL